MKIFQGNYRLMFFERNGKTLVVFIFTLLTHALFGQSAQDSAVVKCDDSLWTRVYHPYRFKVWENCKRVTGTVVRIQIEDDGDYHIALKLDTGQENLLNKFNYERQGGLLVVEIICANLIGGKTPEVECLGYKNKVYIPKVGEYVEVIGSYVIDTKHSWNEIHPVTSITVIKN